MGKKVGHFKGNVGKQVETCCARSWILIYYNWELVVKTNVHIKVFNCLVNCTYDLEKYITTFLKQLATTCNDIIST